MKRICVLILGWLLAAGDGLATHVWNGAGRTGGTGGTNWLDAANWLVDGAPPATPPGHEDDANIDLNTAHAVNVAVAVLAGSTARHVRFDGMNATGRQVAFLGDTTFSTLDYTTTRGTLSIAADATLTLTGGQLNPDGTVVKKTFSSPDAYNIYAILGYAGAIRCTGDQVVLEPMNGVAGKIYIDNPNATVSFNDGNFAIASELHVYETQRMIKFNAANGLSPKREQGGRLVSQSGNSLTNWYDCHIGGNVLDNGKVLTLAGGTYRSVSAAEWTTSGGSDTRSLLYEISGNAVFSGTNPVGRAVYVSRGSSGGGPTGTLRLNGYDLTVTGGGTIALCDFGDVGTTRNGRIEAPGSTVATDGSIEIGPGGYMTGDADTVIAFKGNWDNRSQYKKTVFTLHASTLKAIGSAQPRKPQLIEAQSVDLGAASAGMVNNHAVGSLVVGTPTQPTHARLVDVDDFASDALADAFYAGALVVNAGSTLDIRGLELYVEGQSVKKRWDEFGEVLVFDSTLPTATLLMVR